MMKLRYLFHNPDLAEMLLKNWEYDDSSLELFKYFRISANAVYPFKRNGEVCFLRFCPSSEKQKQNILAELEFIRYLRSRAYPAMEPVLSKKGNEFIEKETPWGVYYACVFKRVKGKQISDTDYNDELMYSYGGSLGQLHKLSNEFTSPRLRRWSYGDVLDWIDGNLGELPADARAREEADVLRCVFSGFSKTSENYGLVHYDFEPDNVFYDDASGSCNVIDFDDAMYHWYIMDIDQALDSLKSELPEDVFPGKQAVFLDGYRSQHHLDSELFAALPVFRRFANLYGYTRVLRSVQEQWDNEPEWLVGLRKKLAGAAARRSEQFGKPVQL